MTVLHIIKTKKLESDGRLLKWISSLLEYNIKSEVLILEDENISNKKGLNVVIKSIVLQSRKVFSKRKGYFLKVPEYTLRCFNTIYRSKADVVLFHDVQQYLNLLIFCFLKSFIFKKIILWDLHELPHDFLLKYGITKQILKYLLEHVDCIIYTNEERRQYLLSKINYKEKRYVILNNYPDKNFISNKYFPLDITLSQWLNGMPYVLWMGVASKSRNFQSFIDVYDKYKSKFKLIIMGNVASEYQNLLKSFIEDKQIYQVFVSQSEIQSLVDNALFSVVLYANNSPNNIYCEPNRLYQLITRKVPVIVGNNPTMQNIVNQFQAGIVLKDDGKDSLGLELQLENMLMNISDYKSNLEKKNISILSWENQFENVYRCLKIYNISIT